MRTYDTPTSAVVHQESPGAATLAVVPVGGMRTEEMPTKSVWRHVALFAGSGAQKILNPDPRRKKATLWAIALDATAGFDGVMIGSMGDVQQNSGAILLATVGLNTSALRYDSRDQRELWAKPIVIGVDGVDTGMFVGFQPSTTDAFLCMSVEQWSE